MTDTNSELPLILDLDGTLIRNDLTHELIVSAFFKRPLKTSLIIVTNLSNKAALKTQLIEIAGQDIAAENLPYNATVMDIAIAHAAKGGDVYIFSGSHQIFVDQVAKTFKWVKAGFGSEGSTNLVSSTKAEALEEKFPDGFQYIGNSSQDYPVWEKSKIGYGINPPAGVKNIKTASDSPVEILEDQPVSLKTIVKALRVHQWAKNGLIALIPILTFSSQSVSDWFNVILGFFILSFVASATYVVNDLLDLKSDREHQTKKDRPLAAGRVSLPTIITIATLLFTISMAACTFLPKHFSYVLLSYLTITLCYSFVLKKRIIIDVLTLAVLFTIRVLAGAAIVNQPMSAWLVGFVGSFFLSLALVKRYTELRKTPANQNLSGRGYQKDDESLVAGIGLMATGITILSFLLYGISGQNTAIYNMEAIYFVLIILIYWMLRIWFLAHRRILNDDPVLFAIKDRLSFILFSVIIAIVVVEQVRLP